LSVIGSGWQEAIPVPAERAVRAEEISGRLRKLL